MMEDVNKKDLLIAGAVVVGGALLVLLFHKGTTTGTTTPSSSGAAALMGGYGTAPTVYVPTSSYDITYETNNGTIVNSSGPTPSTTYLGGSPGSGLVSTSDPSTPTTPTATTTSTATVTPQTSPAQTVSNPSTVAAMISNSADPAGTASQIAHNNGATGSLNFSGLTPQQIAQQVSTATITSPASGGLDFYQWNALTDGGTKPLPQ